jgi:integrase
VEPTLPALAGDFSPAAVGYIANSRALNTRAAYKTDWTHFTLWCETNGRRCPLPAAPSTVSNYLSAMADAGSKVGTIARRLSTINQAHEEAGYTRPGKVKRVADAWAGIRRTHGVAPDQAPPLMPPDETGTGDLWTVIDALPATPTGHRDAALLLLGFAGALRRSELVAARVERLKSHHSRGYVLEIPRSKGDQEGKGQRVAVRRFQDQAHCPVKALDRWLDLLDRPAEGPLFRRIRRHQSITGNALAVGAVNVIVDRACSAALGPGHGYTPHSLRAGLVTWTARQKAPLSTIRKQTRHISAETVEGYIRNESVWQDNAAVDYMNL